MSQWSMADFHCERCGPFESLELRPVPDFTACPSCGELAEWRISAPMPRVMTIKVQAAATGKNDKDRDPRMQDTRLIAEGRHDEWLAKENKRERDIRLKQIKDGIG